MSKTNESALGYLGLALLAFGGLGFELMILWADLPYPPRLHHLIISALWAATGLLLWVRSKWLHGFDPLADVRRPDLRHLIGAVVCVLAVVGSVTYLWGGFKPYLEYRSLGGWNRFLYQYIYYIAEAFLIYLIIAFGQRAGNIAFDHAWLPYGGILLGLTWGLLHIITQDLLTGLVAAAWSLLYGAAYNLCAHNPRYALPSIAAMFIL